jgi:predicted dinucleotide-binding enzyme
MKIAILGTGMVGNALATKLVQLGRLGIKADERIT